jgi:hypothetical protein
MAPALLAALLGACGELAASLGPTPGEAQRRGSDLLEALASRFGPVTREPAFDALRAKLLKNALTPSRIVDDTAAWTSWEGLGRTLELVGRPRASGYHMGLRPSAPEPVLPGEYRGTLRLRVEGGGVYQWHARDELAVGALQPADAARALEALLRGAEAAALERRGTSVDLRPALLAALPRASAAFGRAFSLEVLSGTRQGDDTTTVELRAALEPERLQAAAPRYARFLEKYATPVELRATASSQAGPTFWTLDVARRRATARLRLREGRLAPLDGDAGSVGSRLLVVVDYSTRSGAFRIGVEGLAADVTLVGTPRELSFSATFREEPAWRLPFVIKPFLRGSLKRPFQGDGSLLAYSLGHGDGVTRLERRYRLPVKESWIVRWLGGFASSSVSEFRRHAEAESDQFTADGLRALRQDLEALLQGRAARDALGSTPATEEGGA